MIRLLLLALCSAVAVSAAAQPTLVLSADTLHYPVEQTLTATNATAAPVDLDSLGITPLTARAWAVEVEAGGTVYGPFFLNAFYSPTVEVGISVAAGEAATVQFIGFDPCTVCAGGGGVLADTLRVYSGGVAEADTVLLDLAGYVAAEPAPAAVAPLRLRVRPNPSRGAVTAAVTLAEAGEAEVAIHDVLGRRVAALHEGPLAAGEHMLDLDMGALPSGVYIVRVTAGAEEAVERVTVLGR